MVDSKVVLTGQTLAYTFYCLVIILLVAWFAIKVTSKGKGLAVKPAIFYTTFLSGFLQYLAFHFISLPYNTIPWAEMDLNRVGLQTRQNICNKS